MALMIAGDRSGVGKTTITLAMLAYIAHQHPRVQSFKVGPDYIDPMFHRAVTQRPCRNLDPVLTSENYVQQCFARHCQGMDYALVEGVMGLFDGASAVVRAKSDLPDCASTAHLARLLNLPILLVIDCARLSGSVAAIAQGYRCLDPRLNIAGVVLNRVASDRHLTLLKDALTPLQIPILGVLYRNVDVALPDRHLGLVPAGELPRFHQWCDRLRILAANCFDWKQLWPLLQAPQLPCPPSPETAPPQVRIGIASDRAFNFYYPDNLELLETCGAELVPWSPMVDEILPNNLQGLYLGGGFPEVFAEALAQNQPMRQALKHLIQQGLPTYAECGGLMYLCQNLKDFEGQIWPMVGILPGDVEMCASLTLGYREAKVQHASAMVQPETTFWGHEFHRSRLCFSFPSPIYRFSAEMHAGTNRGDENRFEGWQSYQLHASYLHLHFGGAPQIPQQFVNVCLGH